MNKVNKVKIILAGISLFIVAFVVIATIIMSNVKLEYGINCATPNEIEIRIGSNTNAVRSPSDEQKKTIIGYINSASKQSALNALFNGELNKKATIKSLSGTTYTTLTTPSRVNYDYFVVYKYNEAQPLKVGKKNYEVDGDAYLYKELYFGVKQTDGEAEINVYVNPYFEKGTGNVFNDKEYYHYYYVLQADFDNLFNYLKENWVA